MGGDFLEAEFNFMLRSLSCYADELIVLPLGLYWYFHLAVLRFTFLDHLKWFNESVCYKSVFYRKRFCNAARVWCPKIACFVQNDRKILELKNCSFFGEETISLIRRTFKIFCIALMYSFLYMTPSLRKTIWGLS